MNIKSGKMAGLKIFYFRTRILVLKQLNVIAYYKYSKTKTNHYMPHMHNHGDNESDRKIWGASSFIYFATSMKCRYNVNIDLNWFDSKSQQEEEEIEFAKSEIAISKNQPHRSIIFEAVHHSR